MNGTPVSPSTDTDVSALPAASEPPAAKSIVLPADAGVVERPAGGDGAHLQAGHAVVPAERVDAEAHDRDVGRSGSAGRKANVTAPASRAQAEHQLHRHADGQPLRVGLGQQRLHAHLARQLDVADAVGLEGLGVAGVRRLGREALDRPRPQRPLPGEQALAHVLRRAVGAGRLTREGDRAAVAALRADQPRPGRRAGDQAGGDGGELTLVEHRCPGRTRARGSERRGSGRMRPSSSSWATQGTCRGAPRSRPRVSPRANSTSSWTPRHRCGAPSRSCRRPR